MREQKISTGLLNELRIEQGLREGKHSRPPGFLLRVGIGCLLLIAAAGTTWWWLATRPLLVQTVIASTSGSAAVVPSAVLQATGYVVARRRATVSTQITGKLTEVLFEAGDAVKAGQVLARLDDGAQRAALNSARAQVLFNEAQVAQGEAQLIQARSDSQRQQELVVSGMTTKQAAEQSRTKLLAAEAALDAYRHNVEASKEQYELAKVNFNHTVLRAPFAGIVTERAAQVGEIVSPLSAGGGFTRTGVGTIVDMDSLEIEVDVNEAYIGQVHAGMTCEAVLSAYPDWKISAKVIAIVPAADRGKATVKVRIGVDQKDGRIVPDMGVRVATRLLDGLTEITMAWLLLEAARKARQLLDSPENGGFPPTFLLEKVESFQFFARNILPHTLARLAVVADSNAYV
jgi:HlyD family secretion protein